MRALFNHSSYSKYILAWIFFLYRDYMGNGYEKEICLQGALYEEEVTNRGNKTSL